MFCCVNSAIVLIDFSYLNECATRIQAAYRGHYYQNKYREKLKVNKRSFILIVIALMYRTRNTFCIDI